MSFDEIRKTRRVGLFHGCSMYKSRRHAGILLPGMAPLIYMRPIVMKIQRIITYLGSVLLVALSQINVSFSHTFC